MSCWEEAQVVRSRPARKERQETEGRKDSNNWEVAQVGCCTTGKETVKGNRRNKSCGNAKAVLTFADVKETVQIQNKKTDDWEVAQVGRECRKNLKTNEVIRKQVSSVLEAAHDKISKWEVAQTGPNWSEDLDSDEEFEEETDSEGLEEMCMNLKHFLHDELTLIHAKLEEILLKTSERKRKTVISKEKTQTDDSKDSTSESLFKDRGYQMITCGSCDATFTSYAGFERHAKRRGHADHPLEWTVRKEDDGTEEGSNFKHN